MSNSLLSFPNKKERDDFFIALVVILFFIGLFGFLFFGNQPPKVNNILPVAEAVVEDKDTDNDGVFDADDLCPNVKGDIASNGCPLDTDGDGIHDAIDDCPKVSGIKSNKGCPSDSDGDGVYDKDDLCPEVSFASATGCPPNTDTDGDGVFDKNDKCPRLKGDIANNGCPPDKDGDGIHDAIDNCPEVSGKKLNNGCPDTDEDGVIDSKDKCPKVKGTAKNNGCPPVLDTDGDGVVDSKDKCPNVKGIAKNNGCPSDRDGDGVIDSKDKCPNEKGIAKNNGCPFSEKEKAFLVDLQNLQFELSSSVLTTNSKVKLDELVGIMSNRKDIKLKIEGHTDSTGNAASNLRLSKERAASCKTYLVAKGIAGSRLQTNGFGVTRPVKGIPGFDKRNRRVVFTSF